MRNSLAGKIGAALAAAAVYFSAAYWLQRGYVDPAPKGRLVVQLLPPFHHLGGQAFQQRPAEKGRPDTLRRFGEDPANACDRTSPVMIYEDGTPLGWAHSTFREIQDIGLGHFAHWRGQDFVFSTTDGSNPNTNGRRYWAVIRD